jgi:hypothetical protein
MTTFSHRLYKDEFNAEFVYQLEKGNITGLLATDESSEKVLVIVGELETLQKLGEIMYVNDPEKIKEVFPSFVTKEDSDRRQKELFYQTFDLLRSNLCRIINMSNTTRYESTKEYDMMYEMFCKMNDLMK